VPAWSNHWPIDSTWSPADPSVIARIAVHGASGSGKTTLSIALAERLGLVHAELDAQFQQPDWTPLDTETFRQRVATVVAGPRWVVDGNYHQVRDLVWARAELIVVLDPPRPTVIRQLLLRTVTRSVRREELWNGNRESLRNLMSTDDQRNVVLWSWRTMHRYRSEIPTEARDQAPHARLVKVHGRAEGEALVDELASGSVAPVRPPPGDGPG